MVSCRKFIKMATTAAHFLIERETDHTKTSITTHNENLAMAWLNEPGVKVYEVVTTKREVLADIAVLDNDNNDS